MNRLRERWICGLRIAVVGCAISTTLTCASGAASSAQDAGKAGQKTEKPAPSKPGQPPVRPGKDRWLVKTASDPDAATVQQKPVISTIEELLKLPRPKEMPLAETPAEMQNKRVGPVETTVYSVEADVVECQLMQDGDYRVVLRGAAGETMVMEMPDPAFIDEKSPFFYAMKTAREKLSIRVKPEREKKPVLGHARITGIGFFGRAYGKAAPPKGNLIQLHPVLDLGWQDAPSHEFAERSETAKKAREAAEKSANEGKSAKP